MINGRGRRRRGGCDTAVTPGRGRNARQLIRRRLVLDTCRDNGVCRPARGGWLDNGRSRSGGCDTAVRQGRGRNALQRIRFVVRRLVLDTCRDNGGCRARARGGWLNDAGDEFFPNEKLGREGNQTKAGAIGTMVRWAIRPDQGRLVKISN